MFLDSIFYRTLSVSLNILIFSILLLFTSFFGILIGPSLIAILYTFSNLSVNKYKENIKTYFSAYRKYFIKGLFLELYIILCIIFLEVLVQNLSNEPAGMFIKFIIMSFMIGFILNYALVIGKVRDNLFKSYRFSFILSVNFLSLTIFSGIFVLIFRFFLIKYSILLLIVYFVGTIALLHIKLLDRRIDQLL